MNLTTLKSRVSATVGLAGAAAGAEATLIEGWADEAALKFLQKTKAIKQTATITLTAGTADYTVDASILAFEDVYVVPVSGQEQMLSPEDTYTIRAMRRASSPVIASPPYYYAYEGNMLLLYPTPASSSDTLHIVYVGKPSGTFVAAAGSVSWLDATLGNIPTQYHDVLESYVKMKAAQYSNDAPSQMGQIYKQEWEAGLIETKVTEAKRAGVRTAYAAGKRRRPIPLSPGVDVRY